MADQGCIWLFIVVQSSGNRLSLRPTGCTPALSVTYSAAAAAVATCSAM